MPNPTSRMFSLDFFTAEKKQWVEGQIETQDITSGHSVELHVSDEIDSISSSTHTSWDKVIDRQSGEGTSTAQIDNKVSRYGYSRYGYDDCSWIDFWCCKISRLWRAF